MGRLDGVAVYDPAGRIGGSVFVSMVLSVGLGLGRLWCGCPEAGGASMVKFEDTPNVFASSSAYHSSLRAVLIVSDHTFPFSGIRT